jgi:hypothetical protein
MRRAASCGHPWHVSDVPRAARIERAMVGICGEIGVAGERAKIRN